MRLTRGILLIFLLASDVFGESVNLLDITQKDSVDQHYLTLTFDGVPEYVTSQTYEPPSFGVKLMNAVWDKGNFSKWIQARPAVKYSLRTSSGFAGKEIIDIDISLTKAVPVKVKVINDKALVLSWDKPNDLTDDALLSTDETVLTQKVSLNFRAAALFDVVRLLTEANDLNLILGDDIGNAGEVTMALTNVPLQAALDAILKINGYEWFMRDGIIIVKGIGRSFIGELESKIFELNYADGAIVQAALAGVLTDKGTATALASRPGGNNDLLLVVDRIATFPQIEKVIGQLDRRQPQINIAIKFMETTLKEEERLGIDWTLRLESLGPVPADTTLQALQLIDLAGDFSGFNAVQLTTPMLSALMQILVADNTSKLLQEPNITTFNNQMATISVGTSIPILVPQGEGSVFGTNPYTFENQSVNISMDVTPRINNADFIALSIVASVEAIIGYVGPDADRPVVSSRNMNTTVMVKNGSSLLIGGLIFEDSSLAVNKVPILGDLPLLKKIFSSTVEKKEQRELLIFITPSIVY